MTRRRKITLISLAAAAAVLVAATATAAAALVLADDPAEPVAFQPATQVPEPQPSPTPEPDQGQLACQLLFTSDVLDLPAITAAADRDDHDAVTRWQQDLYQAARHGVRAEQEAISDAAVTVWLILDDGRLGDLFAGSEPPLLSFAVACIDAGLVEQQQIDRWVEQQQIDRWADTIGG